MGQSRPLFSFFGLFSFQCHLRFLCLQYKLKIVLGIQTPGRSMVGAYKTTELWTPPLKYKVLHSWPTLYQPMDGPVFCKYSTFSITVSWWNIRSTYLRSNLKIKIYFSWSAAIAQWICLHLPFCRPGFESQVHHIHFFHLQYLCYICHVKRTKRGQLWPI